MEKEENERRGKIKEEEEEEEIWKREITARMRPQGDFNIMEDPLVFSHVLILS